MLIEKEILYPSLSEEEILDIDDNVEDLKYSLSQSFEHYKFVADPGQSPIRVDKFLVDRIQGISRNRIQQATEAGAIFVNAKPVKSNYKIKPYDIITIELKTPKRELTIIAEDIPLDIVFEDDFLLVVNKPAGLVVHPGHGNYTGTLVNALAYYLRYTSGYDPSDPRLGLVHRIDKDTSGLLVVAKTPDVKTALSLQFFNKTTHRLYNALVWGKFEELEGTIIGNIARDTKDRMLMSVYGEDSGIGKHAVTHFKVIEELAYVSWVECRLETGRTHQIRAHMKHICHPLFSDERYGGNIILRGNNTSKYKQFVNNCFKICPRQVLHAKTLGFVHPVTKEYMLFDSSLPSDITLLLDKWRIYAQGISIK